MEPTPYPDSAEVTQSAFAKAMGVSSVTIMNYVLAGKIAEPAIVRKLNGKVKHFLYGPAKRQFLDARDAAENRFAGGTGASFGGGVKPNKAAAKNGTNSIEFGANTLPSGGDIEEDDLPPESEPENQTQPGTTVGADGLPVGTPGALRNRELQLKVKKAELELEEKQGTLISRDAVYKALFVVGQEIRTAFESVPDRLIDSIIAAADRPTAHSILTFEINAILERMAGMATMNLTPNRNTAHKGARV